VRRVAVVGTTYPVTGGVAAHTTELAHRLAAAGLQTRLVAWERTYPRVLYPGERRNQPPPDGPSFEPTSRPLRWDRPLGWRRVGTDLADADLVVLVHVMPVQVPALVSIAAGLRSRSTGARVVVLCHNVLPHERHPGDAALSRRLLGRVDAVLVHTQEQARLARAHGARRVAVAALPPHLPAASPARQVAGGPGVGGPRLLFFGMVRPYKGLDVLLRAVERVPGVSLTVAGEDWAGTARSLRQQVDRTPGLADRVDFRLGYVPAQEMGRLFAEHDVLALPYRAGTASQNVDLAFAHGLPVLATETGSFPDRVRDGVDGLLVPAGDPARMAEALDRLSVPQTLRHLRSGVRPPDGDRAWHRYLETLLALGDGPIRAVPAAAASLASIDRSR
jgi:glycosyltransferase involved in cell wall biosynthesis